MDFDRYLSDEQKTEIAERAFYDQAKEFLQQGGSDRLLYYVTHEYVRQLIADVLGDDYKKLISDKVLGAIKSLSSFEVFREAGQYSQQSIARQHLNDAMEASKELITQRLSDVIKNESDTYFQEVILDAAVEYIQDNLFNKKKEETQ